MHTKPDADHQGALQKSHREEILEFIRISVGRMNHLETLVLGFATLGVTGWGFLHAWPGRMDVAGQSDPFGRAAFALMFSGLVASAFNSLYVGRMGSNLRVLQLEDALQSSVTPFLDFYRNVRGATLHVFLFTALFVPVMAVCSIAFTLSASEIVKLVGWKHNVLWSLMILSGGATFVTTILNLLAIRKVIRWVGAHL